MIRNALQRFMYGRNGGDHLSLFLLAVYFILYLLAALTDLGLLGLIGDIFAVIALFRMLSRNLPKRRDENARFLKTIEPVRRWLRLQKTIHTDKEHRYFKCPNCGQQLRVPRGKGKITVTCRGCGASFQEKS